MDLLPIAVKPTTAKCSGLKHQSVSITPVSVGQLFEQLRWVLLTLGSLMRIQSRYQQGLHHPKAQLGPEEPLPRWSIHVAGELVLAVGRRPCFLSMWNPSWGCWNVLVMAAGSPAPPPPPATSLPHPRQSTRKTELHFCAVL